LQLQPLISAHSEKQNRTAIRSHRAPVNRSSIDENDLKETWADASGGATRVCETI